MTLGQYRVQGLPNTILEDNNHLGTALATVLPLILYLRTQAQRAIVRHGLLALFVLGIIAVLGTHSRGAFVALVVFAGFFWLRSIASLSSSPGSLSCWFRRSRSCPPNGSNA